MRLLSMQLILLFVRQIVAKKDTRFFPFLYATRRSLAIREGLLHEQKPQLTSTSAASALAASLYKAGPLH